ncbi:MAG: anti-sigma regulatory factor [Bryobacterales bacterium]|nr:anti-sigma regulatory factor [Bryobacterales bacterium]
MTVEKSRELPLASQEHVVLVRQAVRAEAVALGLNLVDQTKIVTAASELARNTIVHGGGGMARIEVLSEPGKRGLRLTFEDRGPGIRNIEQAMKDGFTTGVGLGLGLGGAKRLASEFQIDSAPGAGTRVTITRWK